MMLEPMKIGLYLMNLRKDNNLTQNQLAEKLHISHQAVSKWESGNALPDTEMLLLLSNIYGVTVDDILRASAIEDDLQEQEDEVEETPSQEKLTDACMEKDSKANDITIQSILNLAPYAGSETLDVLVRKFVKNNDYTFEEIVDLAPYLEEETLGVFVDALPNAHKRIEDVNDLMKLAPYLGEEIMDRLAFKLKATMNLDAITELAPYLSEEGIEQLVRRLAE